MGFNTSGTSLTLMAKLTPIGRQLMASGKSNLITNFRIGDSDANYNAAFSLAAGYVPSVSGTIGVNGTVSNSAAKYSNINSFLYTNAGSSSTKKSVEAQSSRISADVIPNGQTVITGSNITEVLVYRNNYNTDTLGLGNLYQSFRLPVDSTVDVVYTSTTYINGGYSDTALSGLAQTNLLVLAISGSSYGECLDGKQLMLSLNIAGGGNKYIYSTFQNKGIPLKTEDANIRDTGAVAAKFGDNIAFLVSDTVMRPNGGNSSLSWSTGFGTNKPFSKYQKQLINLQTNANVGQTADTVVGIAYLDKGILVITHPQLISAATSVTAVTVSLTANSVSTDVYQNVVCIADRGEFGASTNPTFGPSDTPRISEVGLYDINDNLIALAKLDRHTQKTVNEFLALGVKISL